MPKPVVDGGTAPRTQDLFARMKVGNGRSLYAEAAKEGMSLSAFLNNVDPPENYKDGMDSFQRMLKLAGIKTSTIATPHMRIWADRLEAFDTDETRGLFPEWAYRQWRNVQGMPESERAILTSSEFPLGGVMRPYVDAAAARYAQLAPAVPIDQVVAMTTGIDGDAYRAFYLNDDPTQERFVRVGQAAEIPTAKLTGAEHMVRLFKYGRAMEVTYEDIRRQRIDMVAFHIARLAIQAEVDKLATIIDVLINGDGNTNTAATSFALTALDAAATPPNVTLKAWLAFKMKFKNPYAVTTALVQDATGLQLHLLNLGSANVPLISVQAVAGFGGFTPINPALRDNVALGYTDDAPTLKVLAFDRRFAIQRITENGGDIREVERFIGRQTQKLVMSEVEGYAKLDQNSTKLLDLNS